MDHTNADTGDYGFKVYFDSKFGGFCCKATCGDNKIVRLSTSTGHNVDQLSAALFSKRAVLEGSSPACVSMAFCDNPAAVIMTLLEALDEKTQARMMPIYSKLLEPK